MTSIGFVASGGSYITSLINTCAGAAEAQTAAAVLGTNYPQSSWYKDAYQLVSNDGVMPEANKESWISKAFDAVNPL